MPQVSKLKEKKKSMLFGPSKNNSSGVYTNTITIENVIFLKLYPLNPADSSVLG